MKLKVALVLGGILVVLAVLVLVRPTNQQMVHMKNQTCPVSGHSVSGKDTYVYKKKEYNLCSDACKQKVSKNPKKYFSE